MNTSSLKFFFFFSVFEPELKENGNVVEVCVCGGGGRGNKVFIKSDYQKGGG